MGNIFSVSISCDETLNHLSSGVAGCGRHMYNLNENLRALESDLQLLEDIKDDVERRVREDESHNMERLPRVQRWLSKIEAAESEAQRLIAAGTQEVQKLCLGGYCSSNCKVSYQFGKMVARNLENIQRLKDEGNFDVVAARIPAPVVDEMPIGPTVGQQAMLDEVWDLLMKENVGKLGLYGMGGVGKTTLLTQINNKFRSTQNDFDVVIWVTVSQHVQLEKIQEAIGEKIGLLDNGWRDRTLAQKARNIFNVLKKMKFVLLLDDVWGQINLLEIGVPTPDKNNRCKIIVTTRSEDVCGQMEVNIPFEVKCLKWNNAWDLFKSKVGENTLSSHPCILDLAKEATRKCRGLPLALLTVGRAMACKTTVQEWQQLINVLNSSTASDLSGIKNEIFPILKFSFDNLGEKLSIEKSQKLKSCFLYCALFPEDYIIGKQNDLIDHWIGEGFLDGSDAEIEGYDIIGNLVHSCLLIEEKEDSVKMHDVVREMALWITNECKETEKDFYVQAGKGLSRIPEFNEWKSMTRVSLMRNRIEDLTGVPKCNVLDTLLLSENSISEIREGFFTFMWNLRVLDLSKNSNLEELPEDISELRSLKYLNVSRTGIKRLPLDFVMLRRLRYLNLDHTQIENLRFFHRFFDMQVLRLLTVNGFSIRECQLLTKMFSLMTKLNLLSINIVGTDGISADESPLEEILNDVKMRECTYELYLTGCILDLLDISCYVKLHSVNISGGAINRLEAGRGSNMVTPIKLNDKHSLGNGDFGKLEIVSISFCAGLKDLTTLILVPKLKQLLLYAVHEMEEIINIKEAAGVVEGHQNLVPFAKLEELLLVDLRSLKSIYWTPLPFPSLKKIHITSCPCLKKLPLNSKSAEGCDLVIEGNREWFGALEWEDEAAKDAFLVKFV